MWLINCKTLELEQVQSRHVQYAILSHRWGHDEVTFETMKSKKSLDESSAGYQKIAQFCKRTLERNLNYGWVDTCCIDKSSSSELSEAINSMWDWYHNSEVCIVHLYDYCQLDSETALPDQNGSDGNYVNDNSDREEDHTVKNMEEGTYVADSIPDFPHSVPSKYSPPVFPPYPSPPHSNYPPPPGAQRYPNVEDDAVSAPDPQSEFMYPRTAQVEEENADAVSAENLRHCAWFYRAWTLQELLSPRSVEFYDSQWTNIGTKDSLALALSEITNIPIDILVNKKDVHDLSIAERMTFANGRSATRVEDEAYSLFGIFDVNMPLIYGEGSRAFRRLQEEIIKQSNDHTIFVWKLSPDHPALKVPAHQRKRRDTYRDKSQVCSSIKLDHSMFASSPSAFEIEQSYCRTNLTARPFNVTNNGISITLTLQPWTGGIFLGLLDCVLGPKYLEEYHDAFARYRSPSRSSLDSEEARPSRRRSGRRYHSPNRHEYRGHSISFGQRPGIFLKRGIAEDVYERVILGDDFYTLVSDSADLAFCRQVRTIFIDLRKMNRITDFERARGFRIGRLELCPDPECLNKWSMDDPLLRVTQTTRWNSESDRTASIPIGQAGTVAMLRLETCQHWPVKFIKLGMDFDLKPVCVLSTENKMNKEDPGLALFDCVAHKDWTTWDSKRTYRLTAIRNGGLDPKVWRCHLKGSRKTHYRDYISNFKLILPRVARSNEANATNSSEEVPENLEVLILLSQIEPDRDAYRRRRNRCRWKEKSREYQIGSDRYGQQEEDDDAVESLEEDELASTLVWEFEIIVQKYQNELDDVDIPMKSLAIRKNE